MDFHRLYLSGEVGIKMVYRTVIGVVQFVNIYFYMVEGIAYSFDEHIGISISKSEV
jgi:hypothetical protein